MGTNEGTRGSSYEEIRAQLLCINIYNQKADMHRYLIVEIEMHFRREVFKNTGHEAKEATFNRTFELHQWWVSRRRLQIYSE